MLGNTFRREICGVKMSKRINKFNVNYYFRERPHIRRLCLLKCQKNTSPMPIVIANRVFILGSCGVKYQKERKSSN